MNREKTGRKKGKYKQTFSKMRINDIQDIEIEIEKERDKQQNGTNTIHLKQ